MAKAVVGGDEHAAAGNPNDVAQRLVRIGDRADPGVFDRKVSSTACLPAPAAAGAARAFF